MRISSGLFLAVCSNSHMRSGIRARIWKSRYSITYTIEVDNYLHVTIGCITSSIGSTEGSEIDSHTQAYRPVSIEACML